MLILQSRQENFRRRRYKRIILITVLVVVAAGWVAWTPALTRYHLWKQKNALDQARDFIAKNDPGDAHLALEVAFTVAPSNIDAWRTAADMLDQVGTPEAVKIRHHITQMMGATLADQLALINTSLRFRNFNEARDALSAIPKTNANDIAALSAALSFALATENYPVADALFDRLKSRMPNNEDFKIAQAILRLRHPKPEISAAARKELEAYAADPKYSLRAKRELMADALRRKDMDAGHRWALAVGSDPQAVLQDQLNAANLELLVDKKPFEQVYPPLALKAAASPLTVVPFVRWLLVQNRVTEADHWLDTLPPETRKSPAAVTAQAEVLAQAKDWDRLAPLLEQGAWGPVAAEAIRLATSARLVGQRNPALQRQVWSEAIQAANGQLAGLFVLRRLANVWSWDKESEDVLWTIARGFPNQTWVADELFTVYRTRRDIAHMRDVMDLLRKSDPTVARYQHDWALLSLLANPTIDWDEPKVIMQDLYKQDPTNPNYTTGYAFALALAKRGPQALDVVAKLSPPEHNFGPRAPYLAYIYGLNRKKGDVSQMEQIGKQGEYLDEERLLFSLARDLEDRRPDAPPASAKPKPPAAT